MKCILRALWVGIIALSCSILAAGQASAQKSAPSHCDTSANLAGPIAEFDVNQSSPIEALLEFGEKYNLCFGVEYVDRELLTSRSDLHIENTTVSGAIESIFGSAHPVALERENGVIEIHPKTTRPKEATILDFVMPKWESNRLSLQVASTLLHWALVSELNPKTKKGFAGHANGNSEDKVGPFNESNRSLRYLLDRIVGQSSGASWIAETWNLPLLDDSRVWTIVEYRAPSGQHEAVLHSIADQLPQ